VKADANSMFSIDCPTNRRWIIVGELTLPVAKGIAIGLTVRGLLVKK
jgi:hypothetical protein